MTATASGPLPGLTSWVRPLTTATAVLSGLVALAGLALAATHHKLMADPLRSSPDAVFAAEHRYAALLASLLAAYAVARIVTLVWLWQTYRRLSSLGVRRTLRPRWAWASWVYPIGAVVVADISRLGSRPTEAQARPLYGLVAGWWVLWVVSMVLRLVSHGLIAGTGKDLLAAIAYTCLCGASILLLIVIRKVTASARLLPA